MTLGPSWCHIVTYNFDVFSSVFELIIRSREGVRGTRGLHRVREDAEDDRRESQAGDDLNMVGGADRW